MANVFESSKVIPTSLTSLEKVLSDVRTYFEAKGFAVVIEDAAGGAVVKIDKGNGPTKLGLKTEIKLYSGSASVNAAVGETVAKNAVGAGVGYGLTAAVLGCSGIVGLGLLGCEGFTLAKQAKLDNEMVEVVEKFILKHEPLRAENPVQENVHCVSCGEAIPADSRFCPACGAKQKN